MTTSTLRPFSPRSALAISGWIDAGAAYDVEEELLLGGTGMTRADLIAPGAIVDPALEMTVIHRLALALPQRCGIGVAAGIDCTVGSLGPFAVACLSLETFEQAVLHAVRLVGLTFAFVTPILRWHGRDLVVTMDDRLVPDEIKPLVMERDVTAFLRIADAVVGDLHGIRIQTSLCSGSVDALRAVARDVDVTSGPATTILLPQQMLASRPRQANPVAAVDWLSRADAELERRQSFVTTALKVRAAVMRSVNAPPSAAAVARSLHIDERTLRRHLSREGTSYRAIVDDVRLRRALDLVQQSTMSLEHVANRTGYSDAAAFSVAFKRWKGESPSRFRFRSAT